MATIDLGFAMSLPPEQAIKYFTDKGYTIGFRWHDVWEAAHTKAFTVAGVMKQDILEDIRGALDKVIKDGETLADFRNRLEPLLEKKGWLAADPARPWIDPAHSYIVDQATGEIEGKRLTPRRLETIFRVNTQTAYMAGRYATQMDNVDNRPYWEYVAVMDSRTRPAHAAMNGTVLLYDDPFWAAFYPPNGWLCRCRVRTRSAADVARLNLQVISSDGNMETIEQIINRQGETRIAAAYRNPATGKLFTADPGWGYNPGVKAA